MSVLARAARRRTVAAVVAACVGLAGCGEPTPEEAAAALPTVTDGVLTACVAPTPRLVEPVEGRPGTFRGFDVAVLEAVAASIPLPLELVEVSYDHLVSGVALNGLRCDVGAGGVVAAGGLDTLVQLSRPYREVDRLVLARPRAELAEVGPQDLAGVAVGVEAGGAAEDVVDQLVGATVTPYPSRRDLARALRVGDVTAIVVTPSDAVDVRRVVRDAEAVLRLGTGEQTVLVLPHGAAVELVDAVDRGLAALQASGDLDALVTRWIDG